MTDPRVLAADVEAELVIKRSRFITRMHRIGSVEQAEALLREARTGHPDARHHCSALVLAPTATAAEMHRSSDDGEPGGTAGMPMLQALLHAGLVDTLAIVIRYFGGIKLGAGGLVRAYTAGVEQALGAATLLRRTQLAVARIEVPMAEVGVAENAIRLWADAHRAVVEPTTYSSSTATLTVLLYPALWDDLAADVARWSAGQVTVTDIGRRPAEVPLDSGA